MKQYHKNPRQITDKQFKKLNDTLLRLGDLSGIVHDLNSDEIIGGNQRARAFNINDCEIVIEHELPEPDEQGSVAFGYVIWQGKRYAYRAVRWTPAQCEEANIVANKAGGTWDFDILANEFEIGDLFEWGFEPFEFGMVDGEPEQPAGADAEPQVNRAEELREEWQVETGQLWRLPSRTAGNEHRLICGDCTDAAVVERVMGGERAEMVFTSPPYADVREYGGDDLSIDYLVTMFPTWLQKTNYFVVNLGIVFREDEIYEYWRHWIDAAKRAGLKLLSWNIWDRMNATSVSSQMKMFALQHEWMFVFGKETKALNRTWEKSPESEKRAKYYKVNERGQKIIDRRQPDGSLKKSVAGEVYDNKNMGTVFTGVAEMRRDLDHPARFPVELPMGYIGAMTNAGQLIADPFVGSGTTIIAAENLSRQCRAVEIAPGYVAVSLQRYLDAFGIRAELV